MKLYLVRHGDSLATGTDQARPLSKKGKEDINNLAKFIAGQTINVSNVYHSGKTRALETAEIILPKVTAENPMQVRVELDPNADINLILEELYAEDKDTLLVGHMPFMGRLVGKLVTGNEEADIIEFKAGTMVCLEQVEREHWLICWVLSPVLFDKN